MYKLIVTFFACVFILKINAQSTCPILPTPVTYVPLSVKSEINAAPVKTNVDWVIKIDTTNLNANLLEQFNFFGKLYHGILFVPNNEDAFIHFNKLCNVPEDSYTINVTDNVTISFCSERSCFYALQSLMQMIQQENTNLYIQQGFVKDFPKYQWRGMHLDVARHFFTVDEVKKYIDLMALYKFNTFHWHLTDDQGWRIEIKKYPKLTEIGAWRDSTVENHYSTYPRTYEKKKYGGFYTQEQIRDIVQYAANRYITIVPEIEMPGHARAALAAYPELSCTGKQQGVEGLWGVFDDIFCSNDESITFLQNVLNEVVELFPGKYIHIGGDEAPKSRWNQCEKCQMVMKENNLKDAHQLQSYFIKRMDEFLVSRGKTLIGWDEILEGGLSPNAVVMSWRGFEGGKEAAKQEHYVVMSPGSHCYFDHYQGRDKEEPLAIGGYLPLEKVFDFSPISKDMSTSEASYVLGGQANLWTEYIGDFKKLEYMAYPRAIALSEALWCSDKPSYDKFFQQLTSYHFPLLKKLKVNFSTTSLKPTLKTERSEKGIVLKLFTNQNNKDELIESKEIQRSKKGKKVTSIQINSKNSDAINVIQNKALGAKIKFISQPSPYYNADNVILVDGQFGAKPWKGHEWIGFDTTQIIFELELPKKIRVKTLEISFLQDDGSWIHVPCLMAIESRDSKNGCGMGCSDEFYNQEKVKFPSPFGNKKVSHILFKIDNDRKIPENLPGAGHTPWVFIDEIIIE